MDESGRYRGSTSEVLEQLQFVEEPLDASNAGPRLYAAVRDNELDQVREILGSHPGAVHFVNEGVFPRTLLGMARLSQIQSYQEGGEYEAMLHLLLDWGADKGRAEEHDGFQIIDSRLVVSSSADRGSPTTLSISSGSSTSSSEVQSPPQNCIVS